MKKLSAVIAGLVLFQAISAVAIEPLNTKRLSDEDKVYFGIRLDMDQIKGIRKIISHENVNKPPCDKAAEIRRNIYLIKEVNPIFKEASRSADISSYARKYSADLALELADTRKAFEEILPKYNSVCATVEEHGKTKNVPNKNTDISVAPELTQHYSNPKASSLQ